MNHLYLILLLIYSSIRESIHVEFKGPPDPLRGDEMYKRVREAAKVTLLSLLLFSFFELIFYL
jgi:hypothetical protein